MTHGELVGLILAKARSLGLLAHHCRDGRHCDGAGFPDVVVAGRGGMLFAEVKTGSGETTGEQDAWFWAFCHNGAVPCWLWREADWQDGTVERVLSALC